MIAIGLIIDVFQLRQDPILFHAFSFFQGHARIVGVFLDAQTDDQPVDFGTDLDPMHRDDVALGFGHNAANAGGLITFADFSITGR